jgi:hypothetical protein
VQNSAGERDPSRREFPRQFAVVRRELLADGDARSSILDQVRVGPRRQRRLRAVSAHAQPDDEPGVSRVHDVVLRQAVRREAACSYGRMQPAAVERQVPRAASVGGCARSFRPVSHLSGQAAEAGLTRRTVRLFAYFV